MEEKKFAFSSIVIKKIFAINDISVTSTNKMVFRNNRPCCALAFKLNGKTVYYNSCVSYNSTPETMVLLAKNASYHWMCKELGECIMIEFDADFLDNDFKIISFDINPKKITIIDNLLHKLKNVWLKKKDNYYLSSMSMVYELLAIFDSSIKEDYYPKATVALIQPAIDYMDNNINNKDISNSSLAKLCNISVVYFRKTFERVFHISPMKYLRINRIKKAKELLLSDYTSISSIAEATGFSNIYIFSKAFKNETGLSPTDFVKSTYKE